MTQQEPAQKPVRIRVIRVPTPSEQLDRYLTERKLDRPSNDPRIPHAVGF
jgi:hypothetical protein